MPARKPDTPLEQGDPLLTDRSLLPDATLSELDAERVAKFLRMRENAGPLEDNEDFAEADSGSAEAQSHDASGTTQQPETSPSMEIESSLDDASVVLLSDLGLLRKSGAILRPTVAAILLLGTRPQRLLPHASLKLARFRGEDETGLIIDRAELSGTADSVIEAAARFVARNMRISADVRNNTGVYRQDTPEYPLAAVREAITNAVAHRDYGLSGQKVALRMFDDRLEIESPGGLVGPVTLDTLGQKRYSRNPLLARSMYELRLIEEMGTGIKRMRRLMADLGSSPPIFAADVSSFSVTLPALPVPKDTRVAERPHEVRAAEPAPAEVPPDAAAFTLTAENRPVYMALLHQGLNERQARGLVLARERGRLTNRDYRAINPDISDETARIDLGDLVTRGLMMRLGDRRGASYLPR